MRPRCGGCRGERGWRHGHGRASGAWGRPSASHERRAWRTIARRTGATQECTTVMSPKGHTAERRRGPGWRSHDSRGAPIRHSLAEVSRAVYHESGDKEIGEEIIVANYIPSHRQWVREVKDEAERARLWKLAVAAYPPYEEYQAKTTRRIPVFIAEPKG